MFLGKDTMLWIKVTMIMYSYCLLFSNCEKTLLIKWYTNMLNDVVKVYDILCS